MENSQAVNNGSNVWPAVAISIASVIAAASVFILPALDANLPGGSMVWQISAVALAMVGALRAVRSSAASTERPARIVIRAIAALAVMAALVWIGGLVFLWIIWPR